MAAIRNLLDRARGWATLSSSSAAGRHRSAILHDLLGGSMQFIERLFGLYPDAASGLLESSLVAILLSVVVLRLALSRNIKRAKTPTGQHRR
jgi:hypothetical protein